MDRDLEDVRVFLPLGPAIKVLMVWPRFPTSFWSLGEVMEIVPERSLVPPLGLITRSRPDARSLSVGYRRLERNKGKRDLWPLFDSATLSQRSSDDGRLV